MAGCELFFIRQDLVQTVLDRLVQLLFVSGLADQLAHRPPHLFLMFFFSLLLLALRCLAQPHKHLHPPLLPSLLV